MSRGNGAGDNPVVQAALTGLMAGLNALLSSTTKDMVRGANDVSYGAIAQTTDNWIMANFSNYFGYMFSYQTTAPKNAVSGSKVVAFDDMLVWDPSKYSDSAEIQLWIQQQFANALPNDVIPPLAGNLASLLSTTFQLTDNSWEHQNKTYTIPFNAGSTPKTMAVDVVMLSSSATSSDGSDKVGICRMCAVAYETQSWAKKQ